MKRPEVDPIRTKTFKNGRIVEQEKGERPQEYSFRVTVNYGLSIKEAVELGKYEWANPYINDKNFPIRGKGKTELDLPLLHFGLPLSTDDVLEETDKIEYRPTTLQELLALGAEHPNIQHEFPIVALGSTWKRGENDFNYAPVLCYTIFRYLGSPVARRCLYLSSTTGNWPGNWRFATVHK